MTIPILDFIGVSLAVVFLDQVSTYYFAKPSQDFFKDPGRYERNRLLRRLLRRFGLRGQLLYAPVEFPGILGAMTLVYFLVLSPLVLASPGAGWALRIALLVPLANLAIVLPLNYRGGRKIKKEQSKAR